MQNTEKAIRERAYQLWIDSGYQHGNADAHWLAAQREVLGAALAGIGRITSVSASTAASTPKKAKSKKRRAA